jgi:hypothetical protein
MHIRMTEYLVESDITIRAVDRPFPERQVVARFTSAEDAYSFIKKNLEDTKALHGYFARHTLVPLTEVASRVKDQRPIGYNCVLGQFEDVLYIHEVHPDKK